MTAGCRVRETSTVCRLILIALTTSGCAPRSPNDGERQSASLVVRNEPAETTRNTGANAAFSGAQTASGNEYRPDLAERAVEQAVAPNTPALPPIREKSRIERSLSVATEAFNANTTARPTFHLSPVLPKQLDVMRPMPPVERVPVDLGRGTHFVPARPTLPIKAVVTKRARDVSLPPPLPILAGRRPIASASKIPRPNWLMQPSWNPG